LRRQSVRDAAKPRQRAARRPQRRRLLRGTATSTIIRPATEQDLDPIHALFTDYIATSTATFATQPVSEAERLAWWRAHQDRFPVTVAVIEASQTPSVRLHERLGFREAGRLR
jgi:L-amino acid N-acyltransferase YncA